MADKEESPSMPEQVEAFQPLPGDLLTGARRSRGWSRERVAQELNLDATTIAALEENEFERLGAPVFARGHLKKYAQLMGLELAVVLSAYDAVAGEVVPPPTTSSAPAPSLADASPRRGGGVLRLMLGLVVIAAVGVLVWRVTSNGDRPQPGLAPDAAPEATEEDAVLPLIIEPSVSPAESGTEGGLDDTPAAGPETSQAEATPAASSAATDGPVGSARPTIPPQLSEATPEAAPETSPGEELAGLVTVDLAFNDDSWVEVRDPAGQRLIYRLGRAGERRSIQGRPPLRVFLGNADGVSVVVDNQPFSIPADRRLGNTARFVIEADSISAGGSRDD
jgi:cytoskeleton protein RodZ